MSHGKSLVLPSQRGDVGRGLADHQELATESKERSSMIGSTRRDFLKKSGVIAVAACAGAGKLAADPLPVPIGLQLYSVRDLLPKDFDGTLQKLSEAGYKEVEAAGYYDKTAPQWKHAMDQAGLRCISTHHPLPLLKQHEDELIDYAKTIGLQYMICSSPM